MDDALIILKGFNTGAKAAFVGIGSEIRGDDAVGVVIINRLEELSRISREDYTAGTQMVKAVHESPLGAKDADNPRCIFINGGSAPENILGEIRKFHPEIIVFIDAALLGCAPGTVRVIDTRREKISGVSFCTHSLPLAIIANYIRQTVPCEIYVIGIEPGEMNFRPDCTLTPHVAQAAEEIVEAVAVYAGLKQKTTELL